MKLLTLLKDLPSHTLTGSPQVKISHLECDSRRILPGSCYIALKGTRADGHEFMEPGRTAMNSSRRPFAAEPAPSSRKCPARRKPRKPESAGWR